MKRLRWWNWWRVIIFQVDTSKYFERASPDLYILPNSNYETVIIGRLNMLARPWTNSSTAVTERFSFRYSDKTNSYVMISFRLLLLYYSSFLNRRLMVISQKLGHNILLLVPREKRQLRKREWRQINAYRLLVNQNKLLRSNRNIFNVSFHQQGYIKLLHPSNPHI